MPENWVLDQKMGWWRHYYCTNMMSSLILCKEKAFSFYKIPWFWVLFCLSFWKSVQKTLFTYGLEHYCAIRIGSWALEITCGVERDWSVPPAAGLKAAWEREGGVPTKRERRGGEKKCTLCWGAKRKESWEWLDIISRCWSAIAEQGRWSLWGVAWVNISWQLNLVTIRA